MYRLPTSHWSIITKLTVMSVLIIISVGGIVSVNFFSFRRVEELLMTMIARDVNQIIKNASLGRTFSVVLAETNMLINTFTERQETLESDGEHLITIVRHHTSLLEHTGSNLHDALQEFIQKLQTLLEQGQKVNEVLGDIQSVDDQLQNGLEALDDAVVNKELIIAMEGTDEEAYAIEQLSRMLFVYREILFQVSIQFIKSKQAHLGTQAVNEDDEQTIVPLLEEFQTGLEAVTTAWEDINPLVGQLRKGISRYKEHIITLHADMREFQKRLDMLKNSQEQVMLVMGDIDEQIARETTNIGGNVIKAVQTSINTTALLSAVIIAMLVFIGIYIVNMIKPIGRLVTTANRLAEGDIDADLHEVRSHDEIGELSRAFKSSMAYIQEMAHAAAQISQGNLSWNTRSRSERDILGQAFLNMSAYLHEMAAVATNIAGGDLTGTIQIRSTADMFGQSIRAMTEGLRSLVTQVRASIDQNISTGKTISSLAAQDIRIVRDVHTSVEQMISTMLEIGGSIEEVTHNMTTLSSSVNDTSTSVSQMASSIAHIASNTNNLTRQTHQTIESLEETVRALERVVKSTDTSKQLSQETIQDALAGQQAVRHVTTSMEIIQQTITTAVEAITGFALRSQDIDTILTVIESITDQTSLLALNASIIAAQAGANGRGFGVVADEMKNLAQGVEASTKEIAGIVKTLRQDTRNVAQTIHQGAANVTQGMERTRQAQTMLDNIITSAERSSSVVTEIADTLDGLMTNSHAVVKAMRRVNMMTDDITQATNRQEASTRQINMVFAHISEMTTLVHRATAEQLTGIQQVLDTTKEVTMLVDQNLESSQHISRTTEELSAQARMLSHSIDRFRLNA